MKMLSFLPFISSLPSLWLEILALLWVRVVGEGILALFRVLEREQSLLYHQVTCSAAFLWTPFIEVRECLFPYFSKNHYVVNRVEFCPVSFRNLLCDFTVSLCHCGGWHWFVDTELCISETNCTWWCLLISHFNGLYGYSWKIKACRASL